MSAVLYILSLYIYDLNDEPINAGTQSASLYGTSWQGQELNFKLGESGNWLRYLCGKPPGRRKGGDQYIEKRDIFL
jgi:hypothetical protein